MTDEVEENKNRPLWHEGKTDDDIIAAATKYPADTALQLLMDIECLKESSYSPGGSAADEFYTRCGDCGQFLKRDYWIRKKDHPTYTHALCSKCLSGYDGPEYH